MNKKYSAFISYSHLDEKLALKLHRQLERYRLPDGLVPQHGLSVDRRLGPFFRDRSDLPAAEDLSEAVRSALEASNCLIVLCSPNAKQSAWVTREIELFRALNPGKPILSALIEGEPEDAFPQALLVEKEPLAADLRKLADGWSAGFLKIVAGLTTLPLHGLMQRDAQRKMRRVMVVTLGSLAITLTMAAMTVLAIQSRAEAERQKAEAESLVGYMLTDLRDDLRGVGRLDVMTGVNERVLAYYETQDDPMLEQRAQALHALGEDETARVDADLDLALGHFEEAFETTRILLDRDLDDPDRIYGHAQSQYWVGWAHENIGDFEQVALWYEAYRDSALRLQQIEPHSIRTRLELAYSHSNLGILAFRGRGDTSGVVISNFERAIEAFEAALSMDASQIEVKSELANSWSWLSNVHYAKGDFQSAFDAQATCLELKQSILAAEPDNKDWLYSVLIAERAQALNLFGVGEEEQARELLLRLISQTSELSGADPQNSGWHTLAERTANDLRRIGN